METESKTVDASSQECQEARAYLRERTLRLLSGIAGRKCEIHTVENSVVTGIFGRCDINCQEFFVSNLQTPYNVVPAAIVRDQDIVEIVIPNVYDLRK